MSGAGQYWNFWVALSSAELDKPAHANLSVAANCDVMLDSTQRKTMLRTMIMVRAFEEKLNDLYQRKVMFGSPHSYRGQEAIAAGVCAALAPGDLITSYHRGTGHLVAKGADLYKLLCECIGRRDGYSLGRGGKMHMGD